MVGLGEHRIPIMTRITLNLFNFQHQLHDVSATICLIFSYHRSQVILDIGIHVLLPRTSITLGDIPGLKLIDICRDFDDWQTPGWGSKDLLPLLRKVSLM